MDLGGILGGAALQNDGLFASGLCFVIVAAWVLVILLAIWVYRDAESRGMNGVLWVIVLLIGGLIGLIIYLIVRGSHPAYPPRYPPPGYAAPGYPPPGYPGAPPATPWGPPATPPTAPPVGAPPVTCRSCGSSSPAGTRFCPKCGAPM